MDQKDDYSVLAKLKEMLFITGEMRIVSDMGNPEPIVYSCTFNQFMRKPLDDFHPDNFWLIED